MICLLYYKLKKVGSNEGILT